MFMVVIGTFAELVQDHDKGATWTFVIVLVTVCDRNDDVTLLSTSASALATHGQTQTHLCQHEITEDGAKVYKINGPLVLWVRRRIW
jgi:hypothetical protein